MLLRWLNPVSILPWPSALLKTTRIASNWFSSTAASTTYHSVLIWNRWWEDCKLGQQSRQTSNSLQFISRRTMATSNLYKFCVTKCKQTTTLKMSTEPVCSTFRPRVINRPPCITSLGSKTWISMMWTTEAPPHCTGPVSARVNLHFLISWLWIQTWRFRTGVD